MKFNLIYYLMAVMFVSTILNYFIGVKLYKMKMWKVITYIITSTLAGVFSAMLMSFIESGSFMGTSLFGAVLFMPLFALAMAKIFKTPTYQIMNITATFGIVAATILRFRCLIDGCCYGRNIMHPFTKEIVQFPSQATEIVFCILLFTMLIIMLYKDKERKDLYPVLMLIYGVGRFFLNTLRYTTPVFMGLSNGHIWSILSVIIGIIWWCYIPSKKQVSPKIKI